MRTKNRIKHAGNLRFHVENGALKTIGGPRAVWIAFWLRNSRIGNLYTVARGDYGKATLVGRLGIKRVIRLLSCPSDCQFVYRSEFSGVIRETANLLFSDYPKSGLVVHPEFSPSKREFDCERIDFRSYVVS